MGIKAHRFFVATVNTKIFTFDRPCFFFEILSLIFRANDKDAVIKNTLLINISSAQFR